MEINGINEKNIDDRKFIYTPLIVSIKPTVIGIEILSLIFGISTSSIMVEINDINIAINNGILNIYRIIKVVIKNAKLPSKDLFRIFVLPKPTPMIAAIASEKLIIINAIPAIFCSKIIYVRSAPQNTNDAPVNLSVSNERVIE